VYADIARSLRRSIRFWRSQKGDTSKAALHAKAKRMAGAQGAREVEKQVEAAKALAISQVACKTAAADLTSAVSQMLPSLTPVDGPSLAIVKMATDMNDVTTAAATAAIEQAALDRAISQRLAEKREAYSLFPGGRHSKKRGLVWSNVQGLAGTVNAAVADTETKRLVRLGAKAELAAQHIATVADTLCQRMAANESTTEDEDYGEQW
jgi:hypothetical protein